MRRPSADGEEAVSSIVDDDDDEEEANSITPAAGIRASVGVLDSSAASVAGRKWGKQVRKHRGRGQAGGPPSGIEPLFTRHGARWAVYGICRTDGGGKGFATRCFLLAALVREPHPSSYRCLCPSTHTFSFPPPHHYSIEVHAEKGIVRRKI